MPHFRSLWMVVAVLGCAAVVAIAGGLSYSLYSELDPRNASREAIVRHLATSDIRVAPAEKLDALVDRLAQELLRDASFASAGEASQRQRAMLEQNVEVLKRRWFVLRVNRLADLTSAERSAYLDEQIATLLAWAKIDAALQGESSPTTGGALGFFADIRRWIEEERDVATQSRMRRAVGDGIGRWLATHDLAEHGSELRRELALVIAEGLNEGADLTAIANGQDTAERERLRNNGELLLEAWLHVQAHRYIALPTGERPIFIDARIDEVTRWRVLELLNDSSAMPTAQPGLGLAQLGRQIDVWIARADAEQQANLRQLTGDVQARLLQRVLQSLLQR